MIDTTRTDREAITHAQAQMEGNPDPPILSSGPLGWNGLIAERFRHSPAEHYFPPLPENTTSLYLGQPVQSVRWSGDGIYEGLTSEGDVTVKTAGQPVGWHFDKDVDLLVMRFAPAFLRHVAEENGLNADAVELRPSFDQRDEAVKHIGLAMLAEMEAGGAAVESTAIPWPPRSRRTFCATTASRRKPFRTKGEGFPGARSGA